MTTIESVVRINEVYHIGTMDFENKRSDSLEGAGLSVSKHPEAWKQIAKLGGFQTFTLEKKDGTFLDAHALKEHERENIIQWGKDKGYISMAPIYTVTYYDDEMRSDVQSMYFDEKEALLEAEGIEGAEPVKAEGLKASPSLHLKTHSVREITSFLVFDKLLPVYVEEGLNIDGVWWEDDLDPSRYSAPRGVISKEKVIDWTVK